MYIQLSVLIISGELPLEKILVAVEKYTEPCVFVICIDVLHAIVW